MTGRLGNYAVSWELRRSLLWKLQRRLRNPADFRLQRGQERFYSSLVRADAPGAIIDVGANIGAKTEVFRRLADRVVAVEPDPILVNILRNRFLWKKNVSVLPCAITVSAGPAIMYNFKDFPAFNTLYSEWAHSMTAGDRNRLGLSLGKPEQVQVMGKTLGEIVRQYIPIKYIKIDIEGGEADALSTLDVAVPLISLEFNLPAFRSQLTASIAKLEALSSTYRFNVAVTEPPLSLEFVEWVPGDDLVARIDAMGWKYLEVYAKL